MLVTIRDSCKRLAFVFFSFRVVKEGTYETHLHAYCLGALLECVCGFLQKMQFSIIAGFGSCVSARNFYQPKPACVIINMNSNI